MTVTKADLDSRYEHWFRSAQNKDPAKEEILALFSQEPEPYEWTEQDIYEQSRRIIAKWSSPQ